MQGKTRLIILLLYLSLLANKTFLHAQNIPRNFCVSEKSFELFELINNLREKHQLEKIPLSASLSYVAYLHLNDLIQNHPDTGLCNLHSWSDQGKWTACCYQGYIPQQDGMWSKPKELSPYKYRGYELAFWESDTLSPQNILSGWMDISEAENMILNKGKWENKWQAMGVGVLGNYAVVWFGRAVDKEPLPAICGKSQQKVTENEPLITEKPNCYYLIFGSYNKQKDAEKRVLKLKKEGFSEALILISEEKYRVALSSYHDLESAKNAKEKLDKKYGEAWILKY